jgi:alpha-glucosidase (family GH31 glycosyl hydrolase)
MNNEWYDPSPAQNATVIFGNARFSLLTSRLVRLECSLSDKFDDRPSFIVLNRNLPAPKYTTKHVSDNTIQIQTQDLDLLFTRNSPRSSCGTAQKGHDQVGGDRSKKYPNGTAVTDQATCCSVCDSTFDCTTWVFADNIKSPAVNCWLMTGKTKSVPTNNRIYGKKTGFCNGDLSITFTNNHNQVKWNTDSLPTGNLNGTVDALDCYTTPDDCVFNNYPSRMSQGLLSKDGWTLLEDSTQYRFTSAPKNAKYPWYEVRAMNSQDWYFFAYGRNYLDLLADFTKIAGKIAMPPHNAFGVWWSRYYTYSENTFLKEVVQGYAENGLPLHVVVLDMDWHTEKSEKGCDTWGGFSWNKDLFPDPIAFVNLLKSNQNPKGHPLQLSLNVHPQTGVDHCQDKYEQFARASGVDPSTKQTIPCDMGNRTFVDNLFRIYYDAPELVGVDYWWTDYLGFGGPGKISFEQMLWTNYIYDSHIEEKGIRPLVLSRNGGLGNHRYPIGFSGDTLQSFSTLQYEIQMTPTAANTLYSYWSHDIGGFQSGDGCPGDDNPKNLTGSEMFMRWVQFGAVSPIFRTHCNHCERRVWEFPYFEQMKDAMLLRNALVPYLYTQARRAYDTGVSIIHPMYNTHPNEEHAYKQKEQYWFGSSILASPISAPIENGSTSIEWPVWLPGDKYVSWDGTIMYSGDVTTHDSYDRSQIPLFVKQGQVIPLRCMESEAKVISDPLTWVMFSSFQGSGELYEDDGVSLNYKSSSGARTEFSYKANHTNLDITIKAPQGDYAKSLPDARNHIVQLRGASHIRINKITCNGQDVPAGDSVPGYHVNEVGSLAVAKGALIVKLPRVARDTDISVKIAWQV